MKASSEINWVEVPRWVEDKRFIRFEIYDPKHSSLWKAVSTNKVMEAYEPREWRGLPKLRVVYEEDVQNSLLPIHFKKSDERKAAKIVTPAYIVEFHEEIDGLRRKHIRRQESHERFTEWRRAALKERNRKDLVILITLLAMFAVVIAALYYFTHRGI